jgi:hypothetical protein
MKHLFARSSAAVLAAALLFFCSPFVSAQRAGYDLLQTGSDASINLSSIPGLSPSVIPLHGVPICACTGATDTIMHRADAGPGGRANLTVVALFLKNSVPVTFEKTAVDVYITVNNSNGVIGQNTVPQPDSLTPSTGFLTIHPGGTFDSDFTVYADVIVVAAGADVRNPATHVITHRAAPAAHLGAHGAPWSPTPPAGYPECFFPANGFYPAGPVPEVDPTNPSHRHPVVPSSPVSASLTAVPTSYTGHCPTRINFEGTITSTVAGDVTYTWLRSDPGSHGPTYTLHFAVPGSQPVHTDWTLGGPPDPAGWQAIQILTPVEVQSNHAAFTVHCTP